MLTPEELASLWIGCEGRGDEGLQLFLERHEALRKSRAAANAAPISYLTEREKWLMLQTFRLGVNVVSQRTTGDTEKSAWIDKWLAQSTGGGATIESDLAQDAPK